MFTALTGNVYLWIILNENLLKNTHVLLCTLRFFRLFLFKLTSQLNVFVLSGPYPERIPYYINERGYLKTAKDHFDQ